MFVSTFLLEELLENHLDLRMHYSRKFRFVLIDEFQDTSTLQMDWLKLLMHRSSDDTSSVENCFMAVVSRTCVHSIHSITSI